MLNNVDAHCVSSLGLCSSLPYQAETEVCISGSSSPAEPGQTPQDAPVPILQGPQPQPPCQRQQLIPKARDPGTAPPSEATARGREVCSPALPVPHSALSDYAQLLTEGQRPRGMLTPSNLSHWLLPRASLAHSPFLEPSRVNTYPRTFIEGTLGLLDYPGGHHCRAAHSIRFPTQGQRLRGQVSPHARTKPIAVIRIQRQRQVGWGCRGWGGSEVMETPLRKEAPREGAWLQVWNP